MNLPNKLTLIRVLMIPVFAAFFFMTFIPYNYLISAVVFALAAFTDFLDGYIARKYNLVTNLGKFLDPIADKVLVSTALILLVSIAGALNAVWGAVAVALILARELIVSGFRMVAAGTGLVLAADKLGKLKTLFQDLSVIILIVCLEFYHKALFWAGNTALYIAAALTLISGILYIVRNREVLKEK